ncbi:unnamed protein product [Ostreobium quekettii]|uniref:Uncharacterized protein n=1 Tax=Ostreobium quekettii TaxID=121088 RepID=A0A8S1IVJ3_9CHLO|nr:unnamed protein product [Ostreobium quekettii]
MCMLRMVHLQFDGCIVTAVLLCCSDRVMENPPRRRYGADDADSVNLNERDAEVDEEELDRYIMAHERCQAQPRRGHSQRGPSKRGLLQQGPSQRGPSQKGPSQRGRQRKKQALISSGT